jgi:hypothetical protein
MCFFTTRIGGKVRSRHLKRAFKKVEVLAARLAEQLDYESSEEILDKPQAWAHIYAVDTLLSPATRRDIAATLLGLRDRAAEALRRLPPDSGGAAPNWTFVGFVCELAALYRKWTGRRPGVTQPPGGGQYGGPFFRFVEAVSHYLLPETQRRKSNAALGKAIQ